jgi:hypothetical protein
MDENKSAVVGKLTSKAGSWLWQVNSCKYGSPRLDDALRTSAVRSPEPGVFPLQQPATPLYWASWTSNSI